MAAAFTRQDLLDLAGPRLFEQGQAQVDAVSGLRLQDGALLATVHGPVPYLVRLGVGAEGLSGRCECAQGGGEGRWCEHLVAVGLAKLDGVGADEDEPQEEHPLYDYLSGLDHAALVDLLIEAADEDEELGDRLRADSVRSALRSAGRRVAEEGLTGAYDLSDLVRVIGAAMTPDGQLQDVIELIGTVLDAGGSTAAVFLAQRVIDQLGSVVADGSPELLSGKAKELAELHLEACEADGVADPLPLADWLARCHTAPDLGAPLGLDAYVDLLGEAGLARYAAVLSAEWAKRPAGTRDYTLGYRMEELHEVLGDTDALVEVLATDLTSPARYLRIAEALAAAGRVADAFVWAERGLAATPEGRAHDDRLLAFAAHHGGDAVALSREQFQRRPGLAEFRALQEAAGPDAWPGQRTWALGELRDRAATSSARSWENPSAPLIELLVADGDLDAAWEAATTFAAKHHPTLLRLARLRATTHPADAVPVYRAELDQQIEARTRESYRAAIDCLTRLRDLYGQLGTPEEGDRLLGEIRATHRTNGSLLAELEAHGL